MMGEGGSGICFSCLKEEYIIRRGKGKKNCVFKFTEDFGNSLLSGDKESGEEIVFFCLHVVHVIWGMGALLNLCVA